MSQIKRLQSTSSDLDLFFYPAIQQEHEPLADTANNLDYFEKLSRRLYNLEIMDGESWESEKVQRLIDSYLTFGSMKILCQTSLLLETPSSIENSFVFLAVNRDQKMNIQSVAHAFFDKKREEVEIGHVATATWNLPNSFSLDLPEPKRGTATFVLEHAIAEMHKKYPTHKVRARSPRTALPFFIKKDFKVIDQGNKLTSLSMSQQTAGSIAKRVIKNLIV